MATTMPTYILWKKKSIESTENLISEISANKRVTLHKMKGFEFNIDCMWLLAEIAVTQPIFPKAYIFKLILMYRIKLNMLEFFSLVSEPPPFLASKDMVRKHEIQIAILMFVMAGCFFGEMSYVKPPTTDVLKGMFVPKLSVFGKLFYSAVHVYLSHRFPNKCATRDTIALLALIMPHNLFLHSTLVLSPKIQNSVRRINILLYREWYCSLCSIIDQWLDDCYFWHCLLVKNLPTDKMVRCNDLTLYLASFLRKFWGSPAPIFMQLHCWLLAKVQQSQALIHNCYYIQGFLNLKMRKWLRNMITRCIAITPSLIVSIIGGSSGVGRLIIIPSVCIYFSHDFIILTLSRCLMDQANRHQHLLLDHHICPLAKVGNVLIGIITLWSHLSSHQISTLIVSWKAETIALIERPELTNPRYRAGILLMSCCQNRATETPTYV
ncbi:hypothetical protein OSB04_020885 [Centaurea solstitialis]|uniref:Uncharacterized protein n=1 Tax=Centaurea solstitialis TaxID=347529 RepID=A0AA38W6A5_9ASTR|nr:hypothetical protein OSB04_020885 [Centaurea solstitialis]